MDRHIMQAFDGFENVFLTNGLNLQSFNPQSIASSIPRRQDGSGNSDARPMLNKCPPHVTVRKIRWGHNMSYPPSRVQRNRSLGHMDK